MASIDFDGYRNHAPVLSPTLKLVDHAGQIGTLSPFVVSVTIDAGGASQAGS